MSASRNARLVPVATGLLLSCLFAWLAFAGVDLSRAAELAGRLALPELAAPLAVFTAMMLVRSERWRLLLGERAPGRWETLRLFWIGAGALYAFPARLGEFARPALFARRGRSSSFALATVAVERLLDGTGQVLLLLLLLHLMEVEPWIRRGGLLLAAVYLALFAALFFAARTSGAAERGIARLLARHPALAERARGAVGRFVAGIRPIAAPGTFAAAALLTLLAWALSIEFLHQLLSAFRLAGCESRTCAAFLQFMLTVGIVIPAGPGYVGTFHYFAAVALAAFGVGKDEAAGFALLLHAAFVALAAGPAALFFAFESGTATSAGSDTPRADG